VVEMLEFFAGVGILIIGIALLAMAGKLFLALVILPFKLGFCVLKGLLGLVLIVPLALVSICAFSVGFPVVLFILALPLIIIGVGIALLFRLFA
jgi:hypothetical protein